MARGGSADWISVLVQCPGTASVRVWLVLGGTVVREELRWMSEYEIEEVRMARIWSQASMQQE